VKTRRFNRGEVARLRGREVARGANIKPSPRLHVEGAIPVSPDRVSQDLKGKVGGLSHELARQRDLADLPVVKGRPRRKITVGADFPIGK
jgi:hypothetical protein